MKKVIVLIITCILCFSIPIVAFAQNNVYLENGMSVTNIHIPQGVDMVGLGEQTHGNHRMQTLRWDLFEQLIGKGYRNVMLEAYYEDGKMVNDFIHGKSAFTAREVAKNMSFFLYRTDEMATFFQHLKDYNDNHQDKINFYGIDMQSFEKPEKDCIELFKKINEPAAKSLDQILTSDLKKYSAQEKIEFLKAVALNIKQGKLKYEKILGKEDYFRLIYLCQVVGQNINYETLPQKYQMNFRDRSMAENITSIYQNNPGKYFICAHNGHVRDKVSFYTSMGHHLKETLGNKYYIIGTAVYENSFIARKVSLFSDGNSFASFSLTDHSSLMEGFHKSGAKERFYNFSSLNEKGKELFQKQYKMPAIGAVFSSFFGSADMESCVLADCYDGVILLDRDQPYKMIH